MTTVFTPKSTNQAQAPVAGKSYTEQAALRSVNSRKGTMSFAEDSVSSIRHRSDWLAAAYDELDEVFTPLNDNVEWDDVRDQAEQAEYEKAIQILGGVA